MFGINGGELLVLLLLAAVLIGPERLPRYAEQLARRAALTTTRARLAEELGEDDVDWSALDPRRYDPRRIVREALAEPVGPPSSAARPAPRGAGAAGGAAGARPTPADPGAPAPFDDEAT